MTAQDPTTVSISASSLTEEQAAKVLGLTANCLRGWREDSRRLGELIGPVWEEHGRGSRKRIRYDVEELKAYKASVRVPLKRRRPVGRPRNIEPATAAAGTL